MAEPADGAVHDAAAPVGVGACSPRAPTNARCACSTTEQTPPPPPRSISFGLEEDGEDDGTGAYSPEPDSRARPSLERLAPNPLGHALLRTATDSKLDGALQRAAHAARAELKEFAASSAPRDNSLCSAVMLATVLVFRWPIQIWLHLCCAVSKRRRSQHAHGPSTRPTRDGTTRRPTPFSSSSAAASTRRPPSPASRAARRRRPGFFTSLVRLGGVEKVNTLLTIARFDKGISGGGSGISGANGAAASQPHHRASGMGTGLANGFFVSPARDGAIDEAEFERQGEKLVSNATAGCQNTAVVATLFIATTHLGNIGRPTPWLPSEPSTEAFG